MQALTAEQEYPFREQLRLHHEEVGRLFNHSMQIRFDRVEVLLALPKETLIEDLGSLLRIGADEIEHWKELAGTNDPVWERTSFALHAIFLLGELPGAKSLETILEFLARPEEVLEFHLGDVLTECVEDPICKLAEGNFGMLTAFLRSPTAYTFARSTVSNAMAKLSNYNPALQPEVEQWFCDQLDFFAALGPDDEAMDFTVLGLMVTDIMDIHATALLPRIEVLFEMEYIDPFMCGSLEKVRMALTEPQFNDHRRPVLSLADRYADLAAFEKRAEEDQRRELLRAATASSTYMPHATEVRTTSRTGRNEPCPCGSGKKYKKCCLG
ncbi:MAG: DUF1186 domain-containing protein [Flavobacteriales bacterium]